MEYIRRIAEKRIPNLLLAGGLGATCIAGCSEAPSATDPKAPAETSAPVPYELGKEPVYTADGSRWYALSIFPGTHVPVTIQESCVPGTDEINETLYDNYSPVTNTQVPGNGKCKDGMLTPEDYRPIAALPTPQSCQS